MGSGSQASLSILVYAAAMNEKLRLELLALPSEERAELAYTLLESLDDGPDFGGVWQTDGDDFQFHEQHLERRHVHHHDVDATRSLGSTPVGAVALDVGSLDAQAMGQLLDFNGARARRNASPPGDTGV
jgi:hypothetical protein